MRQNLELFKKGHTWRGLRFTVPGQPSKPPLRPEAVKPLEFRLMQNTTPIFTARIDRGWYGAGLERTSAALTSLEPITAATARSIDNADAGDWLQRWAHRFVDGLESSTTGPVFPGEWLLRPMQLEGRSAAPTRPLTSMDPVAAHEVAGYEDDVDWGIGGHNTVLPLRPLSDPESGRVKAWRKLVASGLLPPVLTWNITALCSSLILDGHDRMVAALAEGRSPVFLDLSERNPDGYGAAEDEEARFEKVKAAHSDNPNAIQVMAVAVARAHVIDTERTRTSAWVAPNPNE